MSDQQDNKPAKSKEPVKKAAKFFGPLSHDEKVFRYSKIKKFFAFIEYDWGDDTKGPESDWKTGAKQWQIYKEVHGWKDVSDHNRHVMKREFYTKTVDTDFEEVMKYSDDTERQEFMEYC